MKTAPSYVGMVMLVSLTPTGRRSIRYLDRSQLHATIRLLTKKGYTGFRAM
jgi:hypothetical protein